MTFRRDKIPCKWILLLKLGLRFEGERDGCYCFFHHRSGQQILIDIKDFSPGFLVLRYAHLKESLGVRPWNLSISDNHKDSEVMV